VEWEKAKEEVKCSVHSSITGCFIRFFGGVFLMLLCAIMVVRSHDMTLITIFTTLISRQGAPRNYIYILLAKISDVGQSLFRPFFTNISKGDYFLICCAELPTRHCGINFIEN